MAPRKPFPGLRAFRREESDLFFGREGSVDTMVDRLAATRFLAVLGASGSGKSSLVRTGLFEALELGFNAQAGSDWAIADMHPGADPMAALAEAMLTAKGGERAAIDAEMLAASLKRGPRSVIEWCVAGHLPPGRNLLILVDQFEELFRYSGYAQREAAEAFVGLLLESSAAKEAPISVVITMRSEFLGACTLINGLAERINTGLYLTPRMTREDCRLAIEGPASVCGFGITPGLITRLLNDLASFAPWDDQPGVSQLDRLSRRADQLPLMQHVLNRMWLRRRAEAGALLLNEADYDAIGGLNGALDEHGAEVMAALGPQREAEVATIFRGLVSGPSASAAVRRPTAFAELVALAGGDEAGVRTILDKFRDPDCNFLHPPLTVPLTAAVVLDLSHESLIRQWSPLAGWTAREAQSGDLWRRLSWAAESHAAGRSELLGGLDLAMFDAWWAEEQPTEAWSLRHGNQFDLSAAFLADSRAVRDAAAKARLERDRKERDRLRRSAGVLGALAFLATAASAAALYQAHKADEGKKAAESAFRMAKTEHQRAEAQQRDAFSATSKAQKAEADRAKAMAEAAQAEQQREHEQATEQARMYQAKLREADLRSQASAAQVVASSVQEDLSAARADAEEQKAEKTKILSALTPDARNSALKAIAQANAGVDMGAGSPHAATAAGDASASASSSDKGEAPRPDRADATASAGPVPAKPGDVPDTQTEALKPDHARALLAGLDEARTPEALAHAQSGAAGFKAKFDAAYAQLAAPGAEPSHEVLDDLFWNGREYVWLMTAAGLTTEAKGVQQAMAKVASRIDAPRAEGEQLTYLALTTWAESYIAEREGDTASDKRTDAVAFDLGARLIAAPDASATMLIAAFPIKLYQAYSHGDDKDLKARDIDATCKVSDRLSSLAPDRVESARFAAECLQERALIARAAGDPTAARALQEQAIASLDKALKRWPGEQSLLFLSVDVRDDRNDALTGEALNVERRTGARLLVQAFDGQPWVYASIAPLQADYDDIAQTDFKDHAEAVDFFDAIARAVGPIGEAYPQSKFGYILGDARRRLAEASVELANGDEVARQYLTRALVDFRDNQALAILARDYGGNPPTATFSEIPARVCGGYDQLTQVLIKAGDLDAAIANDREMRGACQRALDEFGYDFYLRTHFDESAWRLGKALADAGRYAEARTSLEYASHWGVVDSSALLASLYEKGLGGSVDAGRAKALEELASKQTEEVFTVQAKFAAGAFPVDIYVKQRPAEYIEKYPGIKDQVLWWKAAREADIPQAVIDSFDTLQKLAIKDNLGFPALVDYALQAAKDEEYDSTGGATAAQAEAIAAAKARVRFAVNVQMDTDGAGIALRGYDALSYVAGKTPVPGNASYFALWNGAIWLFEDEANRDRFIARPERYAPAFGGYCSACLATDSVKPADPRVFSIDDGAVYLFSDSDHRDAWLKDPSAMRREAETHWATLRGNLTGNSYTTKLGDLIVKAARAANADKAAKAP